jgi:alpha-L-fucosidase
MHNQDTAAVNDKALIVGMVREAGNRSEINVNPQSDSQKRSESIGADEAIKKWIDENGESIVGTRGGPFDPTDRYVTTYKDGKIYVHVLSWEGEDHIILPAIIDRVVKNAWILENPEADGTSWGIVRQHPWGLIVVVPREYQNGVDDIVVLDIEGDPATLKKPQLVEADSSSVVYLLGESAKVDDGLVHLQAQDWIEGWNEESGSILWNVKLLRTCDYEIAVTYTADTGTIGSAFEIVSEQNRITGTVHMLSLIW